MLLTLVLCATPSVADAEAMASKKQWDELYLAWAAVKADSVPEGDRPRVAKALAKGCAALVGSDAVMAQSLGEKSIALELEADALLCAAKAAAKSEQRSEAEAMLRTGRKNFNADDRFALELGRLLLSENDAAGAAAELRAVGPKSKGKKEAAALLKRALAMEAEAGSAKAEARAIELQVSKQEVAAANGKGGGSRTGSLSYESGVDDEGRRTRGNQYFKFRYFNGQRDFGQRADYEGRVQEALEEARTSTARLLGTARQSPTDVILYSKQEFIMHHGARAASSIAGFYSENAIRMNDTAEINARNKAVLVHEYVHAVLDEAAHFHAERVPIWLNEGLATWVEWRYEGHDGPPQRVAVQLRGNAVAGTLPSVRQMARQALITMGDPGLAYNLSGAGVHLLLKQGGPDNLLGLFADVGGGASFDTVFSRRYGQTIAQFEEKLADELKSR